MSRCDCVQGLWMIEDEYKLLYDSASAANIKSNVYETLGDYRTYYIIVKDDHMLVMNFLRFIRNAEKKEFDYQQENTACYQFMLVKDSYLKEDTVPGDFLFRGEMEDVNSNTIMTFRQDYNFKTDRIRRNNVNVSSISCADGYLNWSLPEDGWAYQGNYKKAEFIELPGYFLNGLFNYSVATKRDYFTKYLGKKIGVVFEKSKSEYNDLDIIAASKFRQVVITEETDTTYHVAPLGDSMIEDGWMKKGDVKLLRDMILYKDATLSRPNK
ncbi:MAG: hypothetical protein J6Y11_01705 [Paludibacteraceae bacterium]|nr:hypothetical protein [Paludibacteraceae bacterium]